MIKGAANSLAMNQPEIIIDESIDLRGIMDQSCPNETDQNEPNQNQTEKLKQSKQEDETPKKDTNNSCRSIRCDNMATSL